MGERFGGSDGLRLHHAARQGAVGDPHQVAGRDNRNVDALLTLITMFGIGYLPAQNTPMLFGYQLMHS